MVMAIQDNQIYCHHIWSSSYDWRCPKCGMHMQTYVEMKRVMEETEKDPLFIKLKEEARRQK